GGGRCNFTNVNAGPANFLSRNPDFCRSALARYTPRDFIALVERHAIAYHEKKLGQLFCDESAAAIIAMLKDECDAGNVEWWVPCAVDAVARSTVAFVLATPRGAVSCTSLVIATGGLTVPKIGATPFGYRIAEQFGLAVVPPRPALVPLAFAPDALARYGDLAGVSLDAEVLCGDGRFRENLLFTHRGLSGPAILQISSYWDGKAPLVIDLLPGRDTRALLFDARHSPQRIDAVLAAHWPKRFAQQWLAAHDGVRPLRETGDAHLERIAAAIHAWPVMPSGTLGYAKAEVTLGGVDTHVLSSRSMAANAVSGLYFIGEVVDVTGWLGGYNFQWAWSSANAAAQAV
ncbi:MAG TPA: aminoacetone oxidase family FAD-binding enzyme, partial [Casimicrobiaceae bacterium]